MERLDELMIKLQTKVVCALADFKKSERGDTNFVSMLLIIGVVVVLAGLFLTFGEKVLGDIDTKVSNFIKEL